LLVLFHKFKYALNARMCDILHSYTQFVPHINIKSTLTKQRSDRETDTQSSALSHAYFLPLSRQKGSHHEDRNICIWFSAYNAHHTATYFDFNAAVDHMRTTFGNIYSRVYSLSSFGSSNLGGNLGRAVSSSVKSNVLLSAWDTKHYHFLFRKPLIQL